MGSVALIAVLVTTMAMPVGAAKYLPLLDQAFSQHWPMAPLKGVVAAQVEQESDWNPRAHLHTSREDGYGLVQMTRTRTFNIFVDAVRIKALKGWDWRRDPYNPSKQLIFLVIQDKANFTQWRKYFRDDVEGTKAMLVSYNAGEGRVLKRRQYAIAKGLPRDAWTGGLELAHGPAENSALYGRPLWRAVNEYPKVIFKKAEKYKGMI